MTKNDYGLKMFESHSPLGKIAYTLESTTKEKKTSLGIMGHFAPATEIDIDSLYLIVSDHI